MIRTVQKRTVLALLVEVNGLTRLKVNRALEQEHFEVTWTATTQEAVAAYNHRHSDLLLLDFNQPLHVGWSIFEPLAALHPTLPIVMVAEEHTEVARAVADRVGGRLVKPFRLSTLLQTIRRLLNPAAHALSPVPGRGPLPNQFASNRQVPPWRTRREQPKEPAA